jgi:hypothetical protein
MMTDKLIEDVVKITKCVVGDPIHVGNRCLTPRFEYTFYGKQFPSIGGGSPVFVSVIIRPLSLDVSEDNKEWIIEI